MITSALSVTAVTRVLTEWKDSASSLNGGLGYTLCGARSFTLVSGFLPSFLTLTGTTLTLLSTVITDVGSYPSVTIK